MEPGRTAARELGFVQSPALTPLPWWYCRCGFHSLALVLPHNVALGENVLTRPPVAITGLMHIHKLALNQGISCELS